MRNCEECKKQINNIEEVIFLLCNHFICVTCFENKNEIRCLFCSLPKLNHHIFGLCKTLTQQHLLQLTQICDQCNEVFWDWNSSLKHICPKDLIFCQCGTQMLRKHESKHNQVCVLISKKCHLCLFEHNQVQECQAEQVQCYHCHKLISKKKFLNHIQIKHAHCKYKHCDYIGENLRTHSQNCIHKTFLCGICDLYLTEKELNTTHDFTCGGIWIRCYYCNVQIQRKNLNAHYWQPCLNLYCSFQSCGLGIIKHIKNCPNRMVECHQCQKSVNFRNLASHQNICDKRIVCCVSCNNNFTFDLFKMHFCKEYFSKCEVFECSFHSKLLESEDHKCPAIDLKYDFKPGIYYDYQKDGRWHVGRVEKIFQGQLQNDNYVNKRVSYFSVLRFGLYIGKMIYFPQDGIFKQYVLKYFLVHRIGFTLEITNSDGEYFKIRITNKPDLLHSLGIFKLSDFKENDVFLYHTKAHFIRKFDNTQVTLQKVLDKNNNKQFDVLWSEFLDYFNMINY